jgi:hypothetical protein
MTGWIRTTCCSRQSRSSITLKIITYTAWRFDMKYSCAALYLPQCEQCEISSLRYQMWHVLKLPREVPEHEVGHIIELGGKEARLQLLGKSVDCKTCNEIDTENVTQHR